jgi:calcium permeable stress-gated cation channel
MNVFEDPDAPDKSCLGENYVGPGKKDTQVQLVISLALGLSAFLTFCVGILSYCPSFGFPFY